MDLQNSKQTQPPITCFSNVTLLIPKRRELRFAIAFLTIVIATIILSRLAGPLDPRSGFSLGFLSFSKKAKPSSESCDYSYGEWVNDEQGQIYDENCPFLDPGFRCHRNGRPNEDFRRWRWKPHGCDLPRFNASDFLERSRNGRIVFAGDSIGRNQWESLLCLLSGGVENKSTIYEVNGRPISKHKGFLSMRFQGFNLTVEYYRVPFLVTIGRPPPSSPKSVLSSVKVDRLHWFSKRWIGAHVLVFNDGHWWNKAKTLDMGYYFEENNTVNMTMDVAEAFKRSLQTWKVWAIENLDPRRSHLFFRSYSPVHFRNGTWNEGGKCDTNVEPETNYANLESDHPNNAIILDVVDQMNHGNRAVRFLNITYLTELRKDGHPSKYREAGTSPIAPQDCSHWCLPGIPDTWNQILYANLISNGFRTE